MLTLIVIGWVPVVIMGKCMAAELQLEGVLFV